MSAKKRNTVALIINVLIAAFACYALSVYWVGKTGDGNMTVSGYDHLQYFTNLSNYFEIIACLVMIVFNIKSIKADSNEIPHWAFLLKFTATVSVTVTFLTCVFFLGPVWGFMFMQFGGFWKGYFIFFKGNVFFLHFLCPLLSIININFFEKSSKEFTKKQKLFGLLPTIVYGAVYFYQVVVVGAANGGWTDFYNFTFGGNIKMAPVSMIMMLVGTWLICLAEWKINNRKGKKTAVEQAEI